MLHCFGTRNGTLTKNLSFSETSGFNFGGGLTEINVLSAYPSMYKEYYWIESDTKAYYGMESTGAVGTNRSFKAVYYSCSKIISYDKGESTNKTVESDDISSFPVNGELEKVWYVLREELG